MSERIDLAQLRRTIGPDAGELAAIPIQVSTLLALLAGVEAAHAFLKRHGLPEDWENAYDEAAALDVALTRFAFEVPA